MKKIIRVKIKKPSEEKVIKNALGLNPLKSGHCFNLPIVVGKLEVRFGLNPLKSGHCFNSTLAQRDA